MKKLSPQVAKTSPFTRIMDKGHQKTRYKKNSGQLLMQLSENDHKRISTLIAQWLEQDDTP